MDIKTINYEYFLDLSVRIIHHSNAIEGNTLTLNETATIILDSTIPGSKSYEYFLDLSVRMKQF